MAARLLTRLPSAPSRHIRQCQTSASRSLLRSLIPSKAPSQCQDFRVGSAPFTTSSVRSALSASQRPVTMQQSRTLSSKASEEEKEELPPLKYDDGFIKETLNCTRVIACVGLSSNWVRPSYFAMKYMQVDSFTRDMCDARSELAYGATRPKAFA